MKIALISDIHSNFFYFKNVFNSINRNDIDRIYCLGDLVGYYNEPNHVIDFIREKNIYCVKGNHEKYLLGELKYDIENEIIYGFKRQIKELSSENLSFLMSLKDEIVLKEGDKIIYMTHSLPNNAEKYLYNTHELGSNFLKSYNYYCFGHTHIPSILYKNGTCIINPGSVGQPRDCTKQSSYVIIDFQRNSVLIQKVDQDFNTFSKQLSYNGYHDSLIKILKRDKNEG
ncbi:metallophosphoesterase family protein [Campylobacter concisus]|jgi:ser/thr protein phosphatase family protein|uniref:Metallophosphoesterase family protein n=1 Tax=Campylobacter concisus TaxID=199 RepID=A0A7S9RUG7_9BACT|nr:metallophosphoesterase family protein [Campylobacter concisus]QPH98147.1 metallophosphoesterase family protein [Campylobacter concisus]